MRKSAFAVPALALALAACSNPEEERKAQEAAAAAVQAQKEAKAEDVAKQYDMAVAAQDWERARLHGGRKRAAGRSRGSGGEEAARGDRLRCGRKSASAKQRCNLTAVKRLLRRRPQEQRPRNWRSTL